MNPESIDYPDVDDYDKEEKRLRALGIIKEEEGDDDE